MQKKASGSKSENKRSGKHAAPGKKGGAAKVVVAVVLILVILLACTVLYVNGYDKVYPNTYIYNTKLSGMTDTEVMELLTDMYSDDKVKGKSVPLVCNANTMDLKLDDIGVKFDNVALAESVLGQGKSGNPISKTISFLSGLWHRNEVEPVIVYDEEALSAAFDKVTSGCEVEPVGHTFVINEESVTIHAPAKGKKADREAAKAALKERIKALDFTAIDMSPKEVEAEPLDLDEFYNWLTSDARDAYYEKVDGVVVVRESKPKCNVEKQAIKEAVDTLKSSGQSTIEVYAIVTQPENTAEKLTETLYKDVLATYSTNFGGSTAARANNVRLAASRINGTELMPDEEFSYDKAILPRTSANGYMAAPVYVGNKVESGMGGGICQPSSTLYAAALYANLEIVERHNHSLSVSYLPPGLDATIAEGYLDLKLKNSTGYPVKLAVTADGGVITFKILGYNPKNISVDLERSFSGGAYRVTRVVKENGVEVKREQMTSSVYGTPEKNNSDENAKKKAEEEAKKKAEDEAKKAEENAAQGHTAQQPSEQPAPTPPPAQAPPPTEPAPTPAQPAPSAPAPQAPPVAAE